MSGTGSTEQDGEGTGGRSRISTLCFAAAGVAVAALYWKNLEAKREKKEMELKIKRNLVYIQRSQWISLKSAFGLFEMPLMEKTKSLKMELRERTELLSLSQLDELEDMLVERQHLFCSYFTPRSCREQLEDEIINKAGRIPAFHKKNVKANLEKIFREDRHCASCLSYLMTGDKRKNGRMMWKQLAYWRRAVRKDKYLSENSTYC
ncbi:coiled-coil domain-containing protein 127-like [Poecilia reticulata]|uniref:coiled-coil domain-containing protein 127-like n=1 Tax=Poecilia reticulata TaxID=8081 RepID=UPI0004A4EA39|nr:PREDICTED: coiled-coil domain-containing protein 127-like [Poecilia reticulata]XP_017159085.1 PREDICTED: coiled-coil domain-containing protein 127-like [Poecilia reticulata]